MQPKLFFSLLIVACGLIACNSDDKPVTEPVGIRPAFLLKPVASANDIERTLKDGLISSYGTTTPYFVTTPSADALGSESGGFTNTNLQEAGVDEADRIKTDGQYLYVLGNKQNMIKVLELHSSSGSTSNLAEFSITFDGTDNVYADELYLNQTTTQSDLIVSGSSNNYGFYDIWTFPEIWGGKTSYISNVDIENPSAPQQDITLKLDGSIVSSRRVGDFLYIVDRFFPNIPGLNYFDPTDTNATSNLAKIEAAQLAELLPTYSNSRDNISRALVDVKDCYVPTEQASENISADIITVVAINLVNMSIQDSACFIGATETMYMAPESIYLATTRYAYTVIQDANGNAVADYSTPEIETDLHKFEFNAGIINYQASGVIPGHLGWHTERRPFRFSEQGSDLRVVTSTLDVAGINSPAMLNVLRDDGSDELKIVGALPNAQRPQAIGKPDENIYAVRFVDDKAYLVTFRVVDPLYVLDIANATDPFIAGELEIPGYSDYLHPLGNDLLLGLGKAAIPDSNASTQFGGAWYQGLKLSLFDVSNPAVPTELQFVDIGARGTHSEALQNHHAFTLLPANGSSPARLALSIDLYLHEEGFDPVTNPSLWGEWENSGLHLFDIDTGVNPEIISKGQMIVESRDPTNQNQYPSTRVGNRSVISGDSVFYVHGFDVYSSLYESPENFNGPN